MHLECPHCQTNYDIARDVGDAVLVCHQCAQEFSVQAQSLEQAFDSDDAMPVEAVLAPPLRKTAHIWPWLLSILILLAGSGFWVQKDAWLDNRRVRSALMNIGIDMPLRARDWRIVPASVQPEWMMRDDGSRVLLVRGEIKNLLDSDMPLPGINMKFYSKTEPDRQIGKALLDIILTPSGQPSHQVPSKAPARDRRQVAALGSRSFTIVAESVPEQTGDFTLLPALR